MRITKLTVTALAALLLFPLAALAQQQVQQSAQSQSQSQSAAAAPQTAAAPAFILKPLGHNIWAAIANPGPNNSGSNAGFIVGDDGVLVVDTFRRVEAARALLAEIRKVTPLPVKYVVNTHYHIDHVTGNGVFAQAGATIIAHYNVREWIHSENPKFYGANITPQQKADIEAFVAPQIVFDQQLDVYLGSRRVAVHFSPGHTGGDSVVFIPDANVVFTGDLFWRHTLPNLIDASTGPWVNTLNLTVQVHTTTTFVPGHGDVGTVEDVAAFRDYLSDLRKYVQAGRAAGETGDALTNDVLAKLKDKYGDWAGYPNIARTNITLTDAEFAGTKKLPQPQPTEAPLIPH
jgi:cyclase